IIEESHELLARLAEGATLPMITSCSPGWVKFVEHEYPDILPHLSSCKSPQQMFGVMAKTYYAEKSGLDPADIVVVSVMPCTAKKFEADRPEMRASGYKDVDFVLTTRELARMIEQAGIQFNKLEDEACDSLLGEHSGAGVLFGVTGGVMEAALRTAWESITGREVPFENLDIVPVRGFEGIREVSLEVTAPLAAWRALDGVALKVAVAHGLANARRLLEAVNNGERDYHFIEIMACPGGCLGGGGQPLPVSAERLAKRAAAIYAEDKSRPTRKSHENPEIKRIYAEFLGEPLGALSHKLLHTAYTSRSRS
ncbi:iron hydrogenase small subunit, partial [bacterium]|nr:iron hydrogenase small subunit [bacterium]